MSYLYIIRDYLQYHQLSNVYQKNWQSFAYSAQTFQNNRKGSVFISQQSPLALIASFFMIFMCLDLKEQYKFQQPSLRTRLEDVKIHKPSLNLTYNQIIQGIKYIKIAGAMDNECILITFPSEMSHLAQVKNIYQTLSKSNHNAKNIILLSYQTIKDLQSFFQWYYNPSKNAKLSFGIIRIGLNIEFSYQKLFNQSDITIDQKQIKDKAYFNICTNLQNIDTPSVHPDLDYFYSIKDLLELTLISWAPCEAIFKQRFYKQIKKAYLKVQQFIDKTNEIKGFVQHTLCQLYQHLDYKLTAHQIMMRNGFQAGSLSFMVGLKTQKPQQVVISFIKELSLQQQHLHSARVFFYPLSKKDQLPILAFLSSSLLFFVSTAIILIDHFIKNNQMFSIIIKYQTIVVLFAWTYEYYFKISNSITLIIALALFLLSTLKDIYERITHRNKSIQHSISYLEIIITAISALIALYYGLFSYPLSITTMLITLFLIIKSCMLTVRSLVKPIIIIILLMIAFTIPLFDLTSIFIRFEMFSYELKVILIVALLHLTL